MKPPPLPHRALFRLAFTMLLIGPLVMTSGCSPSFRRDPILSREDRQSMQSAAIVTSRVLESPHYALCREKGVAVFDREFAGLRTTSIFGLSAGRRVDEQNAARLQTILDDIGFDIEGELSRAVYQALGPRARFSLWAPEDVEFLAIPKVNFRVENEIVRRHRDYRRIAQKLPADVLIDLRVVEWALVHNVNSDGLQLRLRVRVKVIQHPENKLLYQEEFFTEPDDRRTGYTIDDFAANQANLLKRATATALEGLARDIIAQLTL
jgi:hypothetical protein